MRPLSTKLRSFVAPAPKPETVEDIKREISRMSNADVVALYRGKVPSQFRQPKFRDYFPQGQTRGVLRALSAVLIGTTLGTVTGFGAKRLLDRYDRKLPKLRHLGRLGLLVGSAAGVGLEYAHHRRRQLFQDVVRESVEKERQKRIANVKRRLRTVGQSTVPKVRLR